MATALNNVKIALRIDDLSNWNNSTLILNDGEIALIRMPSNEIRMKCGDGTSLISSLSYVNETEFYSHIVKANSLNIGLDQTNVVDSSTYSVVHGMKLSAYGQFSEVHGVHAKSNSSDSYAYVWNGNIGSYYQSNGEGSFSLNPKNGLSGIYVGHRTLADILADKIYIDGNQSSTLSICHISQKNYHDIVMSDKGPDSNTLYIVSSDNLDMYGEQIKNVAPGTDLSDVVNVEQLCSAISSINIPEIPTKVSKFENDSKYANISVDNEVTTEFKVQHVSQDEYHELVTSDGGIDNHALYIVSSDTLNMYGEQIKNVADATDLSDAVNLNQLCSAISSINIPEIPKNISEFTNDAIYTKLSVDGRSSDQFNVKHVSDTEYYDEVQKGIDENTLYVVSSENINAYGEKITNVADGVDLSDAVNVNQLCNAISSIHIPSKVSEFENDAKYTSISVDNEASNEFNVKHVSQDEYYSIVQSEDGIDRNTLYVVSSDSLNMFNERIENVAEPIVSSDAATKYYVDSTALSIQDKIDSIEIPSKISELENDSNYIAAKIDEHIVSTLNIQHISQDDYYSLVQSDEGPLSNTLYIVSSNEMNMYGERITNVADPVNLSDATNVAYVISTINQLSNIYASYESVNDVSSALNNIDSTLCAKINEKTDVFVDNERSNINIKHISQENYQELVVDNQVETSVLYIVSSDSLNMYGERIENLADATISSDAVNLKQLTNNITDFQIIRPYFIQNALKLRVKLFSDQEMTDLVGEIDSSDIYMAAFFNNNEQQSWIDFTPNGLEENFSNCPVLVKLSDWLSDNNLKYQFERLFISYEWYYVKDSVEHISDKYSIVVPSYTEVGANSSDTVSKTEYDSLVANIRKDIYSPALNDDGMYVCYDNKTNIFGHSLSGVIQIILDSFESYKQYDIKFTAGNDLKFEFCKHDHLNGVEFDDSWNINKEYEFIEGITYLIKIKHDLIQIVESTYPTKNLSYKLVTVNPESDGTTYNIKNRTISTIRISDGDTPITVNLPNAINGGFARDFILRVEITSSNAPFCTFTGMDSSWLAESDDDEWYILKPGTNVISFTEMT